MSMWGGGINDGIMATGPNEPLQLDPTGIWNSGGAGPGWNNMPPGRTNPGTFNAYGQKPGGLAQPPPPGARLWENATGGGWAPAMQPPSATPAWGASQTQPPPPVQPGTPWGMPPGTAPNQPNWQQQQGAGPSYSDAARKNVPPNAGPMPGSQPMRPMGPPTRLPGDAAAAAAQWGAAQGNAKVDQGTPWDVGAPSFMGQKPVGGAADWGGMGRNGPPEWGGDPTGAVPGGSGAAMGQAGWAQPSGPPPSAQPPQHMDPTGMWHAEPRRQGPPPPHDWAATSRTPQQAAPPVQHATAGAGPASKHPQAPWDPNPQTPSMWVPPGPADSGSMMWYGGSSGSQPQASQSHHSQASSSFTNAIEQNNDMMWVNPNPKPKKIQTDKGTQCWGDPQQQGDIKRWKQAEGCDLPNSSQSSGVGNTSLWDSSPVAAAAGGPPGAGAQASTSGQQGTNGWGEPVHAQQQNPAGANEWGAQANGTQHWSHGQPAKVSPSKSTPAAATGWNAPIGLQAQQHMQQPQQQQPPPPPQPVQHARMTHDGLPSGSADGSVFGSNAPTPMTPTNKFGAFGAPNGPGVPSNMASLVENLRPANNGHSSTGLAAQIAENLKYAVNKGLIDSNLLTQPFSREALLLLSQILQKVPKIEQLREQLAQAQNAGDQNQMMAVRAELSALTTEVDNYQRRIQSSEPQNIPKQPPGATSPTDQTGSATSTGSGSKLKQWTGAADSKDMMDNLTREISSKLMMGDASESVWGPAALNQQDVWSPPNMPRDGSDADSSSVKQEGKEDKTNSSHAASPDRHDSSDTPKSDIASSIQEFVPGKPWAWRDPNEAAADPNATPGTLKQNPFSMGSLSLVNTSSASNSSTGALFTQAPNAFGTGNSTPTKQMQPGNPVTFGIGMSPNSFNTSGGDGMWQQQQQQRSRPPSTIGQPSQQQQQQQQAAAAAAAGSRVLGNRAMSSPGQLSPGFWVVMHSQNNVNESLLRQVCQSAGKMAHFVTAGQGVVCVRYQEAAEGQPQQVLQRLQHTLTQQHGVNIQLGKDADVERVLAQLQQRQPQSWNQEASAGWSQSQQASGGFAQGGSGDVLGMPPPMMDAGNEGAGGFQ